MFWDAAAHGLPQHALDDGAQAMLLGEAFGVDVEELLDVPLDEPAETGANQEHVPRV